MCFVVWRRCKSGPGIVHPQGPLPLGSVDASEPDAAPGTIRIRRIMGDSWSSPNFTTFFNLLRTLLLSSLPISCATNSPHQLAPAVSLDTVATDMVSCTAFAVQVCFQLTSGESSLMELRQLKACVLYFNALLLLLLLLLPLLLPCLLVC